MKLDKETILEIADAVAQAVVKALNDGKTVSKPTKVQEKSAYAKTEALLYNYNGFRKIVADAQREIENIRKYGVPQKSGSIVAYSPHTGTVGQIVLPEESVEDAVANVEANVQGTVQAINLIDKCMATLHSDPYYKILEMRYFEGRTQEDIALEFGCSQVTISKNKGRLVKELSMRLFPNQAVGEMFN